MSRILLMTHLDPHLLASYVDGRVSRTDQVLVEEHIADCVECRSEWLSVADLARPGRSLRLPWLVPLAAAAVLLLLLLPKQPPAVVHREPAVVTAQSAMVIAPAGPVSEARSIEWSRVPGVDRYRATLFDSTGGMLWEETTTDTVLPLPPALVLRVGTPYFIRVHARSGFDRWTESRLVEFTLTGR